ncbi:hypothetical protein BDQ94DRAFT_153650 [Aspergillus welwitschiae]|uniref:Uncharacterized protein n=1 Tax=Aspergillus welwitschiae TaxID=1341132 RepID=A0A3F3PL83_9EURO|nr:hypothetical protein BDQ94DRAFT_153650 [Aspergillus welwitschiae]RDH27583.1 hypothetical protein BDQ94DRAFT_153650 [Aspergillus welwitschiae]
MGCAAQFVFFFVVNGTSPTDGASGDVLGWRSPGARFVTALPIFICFASEYTEYSLRPALVLWSRGVTNVEARL